MKFPKPYIGKVVETAPKAKDAKIVLRDKNEYKQESGVRKDHYFDVTITLNDTVVTGELHLMSLPNEKGWYPSLKLNTQKGIQRCPLCSGNWGVSEQETKGLTAIVCAELIFPLLKEYKLFLSDYKPSGWYLFDMGCKDLGEVEDDQKGIPLEYVAWSHRVECPVHGQFIRRNCECNAD